MLYPGTLCREAVATGHGFLNFGGWGLVFRMVSLLLMLYIYICTWNLYSYELVSVEYLWIRDLVVPFIGGEKFLEALHQSFNFRFFGKILSYCKHSLC